MAVDTLLFVSKRASVLAGALLCLMAGRLIAQRTAAPEQGGEVRVAIGR